MKRSNKGPIVNDGYIYKERIARRGVGRRLDAYLAERYRHSTLEQWRAHIAAGRVRLDDRAAKAEDRLHLGQALHYHRPAWREPDAPLEVAVLYAGAGLLAVCKPAGLPTMPGGGFLQHTLVHQLGLAHGKAAPLHRLGRWTSGVVLCASTKEAAAHLTAQFVERSVRKRYRALVSGHPVADSFAIDLPIGPVPYPPTRTLHAASPDGRPAMSRVQVVERRADASLCDVVISTGRPHQIRIHLAGVGHPLVGDPLYGDGGQPIVGGAAVPGDPGYALHAAELAFDHPESGERVTVRAPLPGDLVAARG
ncbi:MAG: 23S rRNA pseudouridine1911/1915/1917 synthase [Bradymonadia bacterium]|jgi:23S rRNA pseudouridine1911/1915/1917 synthase